MKTFRLRESDLDELPKKTRRNFVGERFYSRGRSAEIYNTEFLFESRLLIRKCIERHGTMQNFLDYSKKLAISQKRRRK